jgi:hypothetical protein
VAKKEFNGAEHCSSAESTVFFPVFLRLSLWSLSLVQFYELLLLASSKFSSTLSLGLVLSSYEVHRSEKKLLLVLSLVTKIN